MADAQSATIDGTFTAHDNARKGASDGRARKKWSLLEFGTMVGGFILFPPLGLVALGVKLIKGEMWPGSSDNAAPWSALKKRDRFGFTGDHYKSQWRSYSWSTSGNAAFDAYKRSKLDELEAARRKLDEEQKAFADYLRKLRDAKDRDEFDKFMAEQAAKGSTSAETQSGGS
jgi:hypothetical protein